ncbi:hypothetical protein JXA12_03155 [Candidatus Woesearchaeota archaeon]|nr:hypothetical protein [Candidatus Woesearchaeota archaeon]
MKKDETYSFVLSRKQSDGGFSFAEMTPSTLEDTYYALQIMQELQLPYKNEKTIQFILSVNRKSLMIKHLFQLAHLSETLHLKISWLNEAIRHYPFEQVADSQSLYYAAKLARISNDNKIIEALRMKRIELSLNEHLLSELCSKAIALKILNKKFNETKVSDTIKRFQGCDGGFSFTEKGAPSFIEETYLAIEALSELHQKPNNSKACKSFVAMCKANTGGYGRQITTVPTLEGTYCAIAILKMLA